MLNDLMAKADIPMRKNKQVRYSATSLHKEGLKVYSQKWELMARSDVRKAVQVKEFRGRLRNQVEKFKYLSST